MAVVAAAIAAATWWSVGGRSLPGQRSLQAAPPTSSDYASVPLPQLSEQEIQSRDVEFYERRAAEDTSSATDRSRLAALYLQRARATGDYAEYGRAEQMARRSLELRTAHNGQTFSLLVGALLARHAFTEARDVARQADSLYPHTPAYLAMLGEVELELGDYEAANAHYSRVRYDGENFTVAARLARWREITGRVDAARRLLRDAVENVARRDDLPREQVAWFHYRLGELELRAGRLESADSSFRLGLAVHPTDYRILGAMARLAAAREQWARSIEYGEQAIAIQLDPGALGTISASYRAVGDTAQARSYAKAMTANALQQPGPIHRAWGLFLLDHGTSADVRRVLTKTRLEMRERRDVYAYDLLAWGLYRQRDFRGARSAIASALAQGTEDAQLHYHAGMIATALADTAEARLRFDRMRELNPHYEKGR